MASAALMLGQGGEVVRGCSISLVGLDGFVEGVGARSWRVVRG